MVKRSRNRHSGGDKVGRGNTTTAGEGNVNSRLI